MIDPEKDIAFTGPPIELGVNAVKPVIQAFLSSAVGMVIDSWGNLIVLDDKNETLHVSFSSTDDRDKLYAALQNGIKSGIN